MPACDDCHTILAAMNNGAPIPGSPQNPHDPREEMKMKWTIGQLIIVATVACVAALAVVYAARAGETPVYGPDGKYQGSVFDYGRTQTYTRNGYFSGSAVNNGNGTTSFFNRNGQFNGSAGSSIDRAFNFNRR
jgi:uncharacterized membrane protein YgcG